jgi:hypothetical protein
MGVRLPADRPFLQPDAPEFGVVHLVGQMDGQARLYGWHRLAGYPLVLNVGLSETVALAPAEEEIRLSHRRNLVAMPLVGLLVGAVSWLLLKVAAQQSKLLASGSVLRATLDSTDDGMLLVSETGEVLNFNRRFLQMWQVPDHLAVQGRDADLLDHVIGQLDEPLAFRQLVQSLYLSDDHRLDQLCFKDGRVFERYTQVVMLDGQHARLWSFRDVTARVQAEARLRESEQRLQLAIDANEDGTWDWDLATGHVHVSTRFYSIIGRSADNFHADFAGLMGLIHADDRRALLDVVQQARRVDQPTVRAEFRVALQDAGHHWVLATGKVFERDPQGEPLRVAGTVRDITQRKAAEIALAESEQRFRTLANSAPVMIWLADEHTNLTWVNQAFLDMSGLSLAQQLSQGWRPGVHPDDLKKDQTPVLRQIAQRLPLRAEFRYRNHAGQYRWLMDTGVPRYNPAGEFLGYVGSAVDITELKQHRERLEDLVAERTARLAEATSKLYDTQFAMDRVGIGIHWVDAETAQFMYVNSYAAGLVGYSPEEMASMTLVQVDAHLTMDAFHRLADGVRERGHLRTESEVRHRDGHTTAVELAIFHLPGTGEARSRFISFITDISGRKQAEQALVKAKEEAESGNAAKSSFLANMSHEIRTPLNAITGMTYLLRHDKPTDRQAHRLDSIDAAGRHLMEIINAVLDLAKIEAGKLLLDESPVRLREVMANVASILQASVQAKGLQLTLHAPEMAWHLLGDAARLQQALLNFAGNAVKFTSAGRIELDASVQDDGPGTALVTFSVRDTGIGITQETLVKLFTPFEQGDNSTTRSHGGTGLGLVITKRLAELMGGTAGATSTPGQGSTFWFTARLKKHAGLPMPPSDAHARAETLLLRHHVGRRVLLAEDDPTNRDVIEELLASVGLDCEVACDGQEAVDKALATDFDLILMDMQMPRLDGLAAARQICAHAKGSPPMIVALTANVFAEDKQRCLDAGMREFLPKPVDPAKLYATLLDALNRVPRKPT